MNAVGRAFAVYKLRAGGLEVDVSIPRRDRNVGPGHRGIEVTGDPTMSPVEAARRRDLTVNAIMVDLNTGELLDPFGGVEDLERKCLREVDPDTFLEDPLRALRVVQFAARLGARPTDSLVALCCTAPLHELPAERVQGEWDKLLLRSGRPSVGLDVAREADILSRVFPEWAPLDRPDLGSLLDRLARHRSEIDETPRAWAMMLAGWLDGASGAIAEATLDRLGVFTRERYRVREQVLALLAIRHARDPDPAHLARRARARELGVERAPPSRWVEGRDLKGLGMAPGPAMGELLREVYRAQLDGAVRTREEALALAARALD